MIIFTASFGYFKPSFLVLCQGSTSWSEKAAQLKIAGRQTERKASKVPTSPSKACFLEPNPFSLGSTFKFPDSSTTCWW